MILVEVLDGSRTGKKVIIAVTIMINGESFYDNNTCILFISQYRLWSLLIFQFRATAKVCIFFHVDLGTHVEEGKWGIEHRTWTQKMGEEKEGTPFLHV